MLMEKNAEEIFKHHYQTPIGVICIEAHKDAITGVYMEADYEKEKERETGLMKEAHLQLQEYFKGKRQTFELPLELKGTKFQKKVWEALRTIPYGKTRSYKEIAEQIGNAGACRAVGNANNKNKILIIVPCHRVIGADGSLVGFGAGIKTKEYLLQLERYNKKQ